MNSSLIANAKCCDLISVIIPWFDIIYLHFLFMIKEKSQTHIYTIQVVSFKTIFYNTMNISQTISPKRLWWEIRREKPRWKKKNNLSERFDDYVRLVTWAA